MSRGKATVTEVLGLDRESDCYISVGLRLCQGGKRLLQKCVAKIVATVLHKWSAKVEARGGKV